MSITENPHISNALYSNFIALSRYARWLPDKGRRETWEETVGRYTDYWVGKGLIQSDLADELYTAIHTLEVMPSMRALMTAGVAADRDNVAVFNCTYTSISTVTDFDEILYILTTGAGVGFSCERQFVSKLPTIGEPLSRSIYDHTQQNYPGIDKEELSWIDGDTIHVADSKYGWASALRILIVELYNGNFNVTWDVSLVRPKGRPLITFGGRASGPGPLEELFKYVVRSFKSACHYNKTNKTYSEGCKLNSIDVHGITCKIASVVVAGGTRRSALISLSNLSDDRMRHAKSGQWWEQHDEYALANNSVCYTERPDAERFLEEWTALVKSKSGERGIFNREAAKKTVRAINKRHRSKYNDTIRPLDVPRRDEHQDFGCNPCSEILLRDGQMCNLTEVVIRHDDTETSLKKKVRLATIMGTLQATMVDFCYLSPKWKLNTEEEALLGVSMTGIMDNPLTAHATDELRGMLERLRDYSEEVNLEYAKLLGIKPSAAITSVKPSGCTTLDTSVRTESGSRYLKDIFEENSYYLGDMLEMPDGTWLDLKVPLKVYDENNDLQDVTKLFVNGKSDVYTITFEDGRSYAFTAEHKLKTTSGWKRVDQLTADDDVVSYQDNTASSSRVKNIELGGYRRFTVDMEVANTHTYQLDNGCVSHNTVSQLVDSASGIHARYSRYYIRTVRGDVKDPIVKLMQSEGFIWEPNSYDPANSVVFSFPMKSPECAVLRDEKEALEQLELWLLYQRHWCDHKPSITVFVKDEEWMDVGAWVFKHFDEVSGVSFLPHSDHTYVQAPYQECDEATYNDFVARTPKHIDWSLLGVYEKEDRTEGAKTLSCTGGVCEVVDLVN